MYKKYLENAGERPRRMSYYDNAVCFDLPKSKIDI